MPAPRPRNLGRPAATDHAAIERAAFSLFETQGFDDTTVEQIAQAVGVGKRTVFRYFPSKNDIPWGEFGESLDAFRSLLASMPEGMPLWEAVHRGVRAFNAFDDDTMLLHRQRMTLILTTPTLQAHSVHQYAEWRRVIAEYVAKQLGQGADDLLPRVVGHVSLALAISAYEQWLADEEASLTELIDTAMTGLQAYLE